MMKLPNVKTGIISDLHIPAQVKYALEFAQDTFSDHKVQQVIAIGDIFDHHYMSRHTNETSALNPLQELAKAKREIQRWVTAFPNLIITKGNHDMIPQRQGKTLGIPAPFISDLNTIYDLPKTWQWVDELVLFDDVLVNHGLGSNGMYGVKNTAIKLGCSYIQGHSHAHAAVFSIPRKFKNNAAMNVGCLMDAETYNAKYAKGKYLVPTSLGLGICNAVDDMTFVPYRG